ncbi:MAG: bifunctional diguanylate cyclase/phosphodiesterase, partial [Pseudomonadota bacterium]
DTLGHDVGDELLKRVTTRIRGLLRDSDVLGRLGGDEFVIILEALEEDLAPQRVSERIIETLTKSFLIHSQEVTIGTSIGIAISPDDGTDRDALLKCADSAMYTAKNHGASAFSFYREEVATKAARHISIESAIRHSLAEQEFFLEFQPIIDLKTREVVKAEALIRWRHSELGLIPPDEFIPIAEEYGLIVQIGEWVLRNTCKAIEQFDQEGCYLESIAINTSSLEFVTGNMASRFEGILKEYGVTHSRIDLEITERNVLGECEGTEAELQRLRSLGHSICVDDFGTGYSSLSYMKRLPLNIVKIDKSFIQNIPYDQNDVAISDAIIKLSHSLGYQVVAEGVETDEQLEYLLAKGCDYAQGYLLSKPVRQSAFAHTVEDIHRRLSLSDTLVQRIRRAAFQ